MGKVSDAFKRHEAESGGQGEQTPQVEPGAEPAAATVPAPAARGRVTDLLVAYSDRGSLVNEEYRALRTNLLAACPAGEFAYVVTSARAGEGKTVTCMNLAVVMSERAGKRTVLVDGNLRNGRLSRYMKAQTGPGLAEVLRGQVPLEQAVRPGVCPNLSFLSAGKVNGDVSELLGTPKLSETAAALRKQFDHCVFDTPAIHSAADAAVVAEAVGEALLVLRMYRTPRESADRAIRLLRAANVKVAGIILTDRKFFIPGPLYRHL